MVSAIRSLILMTVKCYLTKGDAMTREEKIIQANKDYQEAKRLLNVQYAEKFEQLPCTECGEVYAEDVLALNEWVETESKRLLNEWVNHIVHA